MFMILFVDEKGPSLQSLKSSDFHDFLHNRRVGSWSPRSTHLLFMALSHFEICQQQCEPHWDFVNTYVLRASNSLCDNPLRDIADTMCWEPQIDWDISQTDFWNVRIDCGFTVEWCGWGLFSVFAEFMIWAFIMEMQKSCTHSSSRIAFLNQSLAENNDIK
jgi:hypothetical protein